MDRREGRAATHSASSGAATPAVLHETARAHMQAGRHLDAQICCQRALAIDSGHADSLHLMGLLSLHATQYDHAVEWISRAIGQAPKAEYVSSLGIALQRAGRLEEATKALDKVVQLAPNQALHWTNLGNVLAECQRPSDAVLCFQHALELAPDHWEAAWQCAVLLQQSGRLEEALAHFDRCDALRPHHLPTVASRSLLLRDLKRFEEYLAGSRQAHALDPNNAEICNNCGDALLMFGRFEEALAWFDRALELRPSAIFVLENQAAVFKKMHRFDEAFATYHRIRSIDPGNAKAEFASAVNSLLLGDFETGWREREARWRVSGLPVVRWNGAAPVWSGEESIEGKTILVYSDEGLGDAIQFARYVPMLAARGARVVLVVPDSLHPLLSTMPGLSQCLPNSAATLPAIDVCSPVSSLPLAFKTALDSIPPPIRLSPCLDRVTAWETRLGPHNRLRVGLVWSGNPTHPNDRSRSIPLRSLARILDVDATFVSLQRDPRSDDKAFLLERADIVDLTADLTDFSETAALVHCLDLVITVDTSVAHLAGTLGCPTWILLPYVPDWRWLLDRDDSPWYPTVRLFRQTETREYATVQDRVRGELLTLTSDFDRRHQLRCNGIKT